jgi:cell division protein FtsN
MAGGNGKRGGDRVLESRHLVGIFLGVVLLCGVFFTLGYVMGRAQYGGPVQASESAEKSTPPKPSPAKPKGTEASPAPAPGEWDFYTKKNNNHLEPAARASASPSVSVPSETAASKSKTAPPPVVANTDSKTSNSPGPFHPPKMLKGVIVVQLAALTKQSDALAMADAVQQKKFPSFVLTPTTDNFYRVQVGPYPDQPSAESAKRALEQLGFKPIIKR